MTTTTTNEIYINADYKRITDLNTQPESEEMQKVFHVNGNKRKAGVTIPISDKQILKLGL